jgi:hypothetical protein
MSMTDKEILQAIDDCPFRLEIVGGRTIKVDKLRAIDRYSKKYRKQAKKVKALINN